MAFDATMFLASVVLAGVFLALGHVKKVRIFNLFAVVVFIFLMTQLYESVPLLVLFIGLSLYEIYFTFWDGRDGGTGE